MYMDKYMEIITMYDMYVYQTALRVSKINYADN